MWRWIFILTFILSGPLWSVSYTHEVSGTYQLKNKAIGFTLTWREENGKIHGRYKDDVFSENAVVEGLTSAAGKTFQIEFPQTKNQIRSLTILSSREQPGEKPRPVSLTILARDARGQLVATTQVQPQVALLASTAQKEEELACTRGFGELAGYCGFYGGVMREETDPQNLCQLTSANGARLEFNFDRELTLHLGEVSPLINLPVHWLGQLPVNAKGTNFNVNRRVCSPLSGVSLPEGSCKKLELDGTFFVEDDVRRLRGTYRITDERNRQGCSYSFLMIRR